MRFVKLTSPAPAIDYIASTLRQHLEAGEHVLWLVSGGSVITLAVAVTRQLASAPVDHLTVSLADERPGPVGHADSNWQRLLNAGLNLPGARLHAVLAGAETAADTTTFANFLDHELTANEFTLGLFGIGPDGHTAGLPAQAAAVSDQPAAYYEAGDFKRLSMTPASIARLSEAVVYMSGEAKRPAFERFESDLPYAQQSAQALKAVPNLTVFNSFKGDRA